MIEVCYSTKLRLSVVAPNVMKTLTETVLSYTCPQNTGKDAGCDFIFWKNTSGRWFDRDTAKRLLEQRELNDLHGFFNRNGEPYVASVKMNDNGNVEFLGGGESTSSAEDAELCPCPSCDGGIIRANSTMYACDVADCKFRGLAQEMCKRKITEDEARAILMKENPHYLMILSQRKAAHLVLISDWMVIESNLNSLHGKQQSVLRNLL